MPGVKTKEGEPTAADLASYGIPPSNPMDPSWWKAKSRRLWTELLRLQSLRL